MDEKLYKEMLEALKWFNGRVDNGEVRSVETYDRFEKPIQKAGEPLTNEQKLAEMKRVLNDLEGVKAPYNLHAWIREVTRWADNPENY